MFTVTVFSQFQTKFVVCATNVTNLRASLQRAKYFLLIFSLVFLKMLTPRVAKEYKILRLY